MKKITVVGLLIITVLSACKKDQSSSKNTEVNNFTELKVPANFTFNTSKSVNLNVDVDNNPGFTKAYKIEVYDASPYAGGSLMYSGLTSGDQVQASFELPEALKWVYLVKVDPTGSTTMARVDISGNSINYTFGKGKMDKKTVVASPSCNSGCTQTISGGNNLDINNSGTYCVTGNITGINDNNGNATIRICGNVTISGNASIKGNTVLQVTDGSSLTVQGINMNDSGGKKGSIVVYTTGTLTVTGNFPANGTVTNHGTFNVNSDSYIYGTFTNNGTFHTKGTGFSTLNNNGPITNNGTMIYNGNLTENNNTTFINNCQLWVKRQFEINSLVNNYSYIQVDQNFRSNGSSLLNFYNGAMMFVKGNAAGPLNGDMNGNGSTSVVKITGGISSNSGADFTGNLEICASSYGTNSSNNITQNGALKSGAVAACNQAYIPTSACNPEGNGTPTVVDTDGDGVADENDLFPNDALRAGESFYPGSATYGSLAFEDLWPAKGDYDFNDIVVDYRLRMVTNASNNVVDIQISYALRSIGGSFKNGMGIELNVPSSAVASVTRSNTLGNLISLNGNGTEANQVKAVIILFDNAFNVLANNGTATVNTIIGATPSAVDTSVISLTFTSARTMAELGSAPFNPFIFINQDRGREVHLSGKAPTSLANSSFFGSVDDDTNPGQGRYYVTSTNLPWALNIAQHWNYPSEKEDIVQAYLKFADWAQSGGSNSADWYLLDQPSYRNSAKIY
ncbi:MAG: LruC domain-containing protein [Owenweeksia sp.]